MKITILLLSVLFCGTVASAAQRSGNTSFDGIQVKVTVDPDKEIFQIGESKFESKVVATSAGHVMSGSSRVGIMTWDETLTATIFLDGGNGGNPSEYNCENARVKITRVSDDGKVTNIKNECAYLQ